MPAFISQLRRRSDRNSWMSIEDERKHAAMLGGAVRPEARLAGPPNFNDPVPPLATPPPTYSQVRNLSRPEIANLITRYGTHHGSPRALNNATPRDSLPPAISSNLATLEDIRHNEVVHHVHVNNRLSSVPNYPVFLEHPPNPARNRRSRRPSSVASASTTGIFISVGQLPGSIPFDDDPAHNVLNQCAALGSHPISSPPLVSPLSPFEAAVAQAVTVQRVQTISGAPTRLSRSAHHTSCFLERSQDSDGGWNPPARGFYAPDTENQPSIRASQTWPAREQRAAMQRADPRVRFSKPRPDARDINIPPSPPPKDPGYVARQPNPGRSLRKPRSTPTLLVTLRRINRDGRDSVDHEDIQSGGNNDIVGMSERKRHFSTRKSSNRPSQILNACARFIGRSSPRVAVSC